MKPDWTLIANATHARLLQQENDNPMVLLRAFEHPKGRLHTSELGDAPAGRELSGRGFGGAAFEPRMDPHRKEHLHFAHELADCLEKGAQSGDYGSLAIFSSSPFLGELKARLGHATLALLKETHDVDLTSVGPAEIERRIRHETSARR